MFKGRVYFFVFFWICLSLGTAWFFHVAPTRSLRSYQRLMEYSDLAKKNEGKVFKAEQRRIDVSKQILFSKENERLQWRLQSASSELSLDQQDDAIELIERFKEVSCVMQESFSPDQQYVRCLTAEDAIYHYKNEQLVADRANMTRYEIPGHDWISSFEKYVPMLKGQAEKIELTFKNRNPSFKAQKFQASLHESELL